MTFLPLTFNIIPPPGRLTCPELSLPTSTAMFNLSLPPLSLLILPHDQPPNHSILSNFHLSRRLWLPSLPSTVPSPSPNKSLSNSWFSSSKFTSNSFSPLTIFDSSLSLPSPATRTIKIQFVPSPLLRQKLKLAFEVTHTLYNYCVYLISLGYPATLQSLRDLLINSPDPSKTYTNCFPPNVQSYFDQVPYDVRDGALRDFIKAYSIQQQLVREDKKSHFEMHQRSKTDIYEKSIVLRHSCIKQSTAGVKFYPRSWTKDFINFNEVPPIIKHDCRITMTPDNRFYLIIPVDIVDTNTLKVRKCNVAALDPGVKIFQTVYGSDGAAYMVGENDINKLDKMSKIATRMREGIKKVKTFGETTYRQAKNKKERKALKKNAALIEKKIKNKISDIHRKTVKFLCDKYDTVIVPDFRTQNMATKRSENGVWKRLITKETTRKMIRWNHYKFRELLKAKGEVTGTKIVVGTEEWTSKTCTGCGKIKHELTLRDREYECGRCGYKGNRDISAARNIMILNWSATARVIE